MSDTRDENYARRLEQRGGARWKRLLRVQAPYQLNIRRQRLGRTLDVGCGIGRNLESLDRGSVGVDHNPTSIDIARRAGYEAVTTDKWRTSDLNRPDSFDGLLIAHVIEHMDRESAQALMAEYVRVLRPGGRAFLICPQERGYATDATHVAWTTGEDMEDLARGAGLVPGKWRSFPFPRPVGRVFPYNEFNVLAVKPIVGARI